MSAPRPAPAPAPQSPPPLSPQRHEAFARSLADGIAEGEAYRLAGFKENAASAVRLRQKPEVAARVAWLQQQTAAAAVPNSAPEPEAAPAPAPASDTVPAPVAPGALTIAEKRAFLRRVVETPVASVGPDDPICEEYVRTARMKGRGENAEEWQTERVKLPDKLKAIQLDNALAADAKAAEPPVAPTLSDLMLKIAEIRSRVKVPQPTA